MAVNQLMLMPPKESLEFVRQTQNSNQLAINSQNLSTASSRNPRNSESPSLPFVARVNPPPSQATTTRCISQLGSPTALAGGGKAGSGFSRGRKSGERL
jgi:hypothetical protein